MYAALEKKWKEIIDAPSGSESRYFRHKTAFDNLYGNKASTRPSSTLDTDADEPQPSTSGNSEAENKSTKKNVTKGNPPMYWTVCRVSMKASKRTCKKCMKK